ncbi:MAG TPA: hypothetical protein VFC35_06875 [Gemmatimonadaceae bacterium]|nr:hypothetical protein [Gemmatimonadaceae bacterium]
MGSRIVRALMACAFLFTSRVCLSQGVSGVNSLTPTSRISSILAPVSSHLEFAVSSDSVAHRQQETFLGSDKVKHFLMSGFIDVVGFSALQAVGANRGASLGVATTVTMATGIGRELHDRRTKGLFSVGDLTWDAIGTGAALLLISHSQR